MEIKITRPQNEHLLEQSKIRWKLLNRTSPAFAAGYGLVGVILLVAGILTNKADGTFWNAFTCFGTSFIYVALIYFYQTYTSRERFFSKIKSDIARYNKQKSTTEITISDEMITTRNLNSYYELKWPLFNAYMLYKDHFVFMTGDQAAVIIHKNELSPQELTTLTQFLQSKFGVKR